MPPQKWIAILTSIAIVEKLAQLTQCAGQHCHQHVRNSFLLKRSHRPIEFSWKTYWFIYKKSLFFGNSRFSNFGIGHVSGVTGDQPKRSDELILQTPCSGAPCFSSCQVTFSGQLEQHLRNSLLYSCMLLI